MGANSSVTDLTYLNELANGDKAFINEMITVFLEQTPEAIVKLGNYCTEKNWKMLRATAHKMKPSFSFVGLKDLAAVINSIEEYADSETHLDLLPEMISNVKRTCTQALEELKEKKGNL
jgi:HPt (histidine-containing phosphotransfer) domain-containing protein